jgi:hypothetical protein
MRVCPGNMRQQKGFAPDTGFEGRLLLFRRVGIAASILVGSRKLNLRDQSMSTVSVIKANFCRTTSGVHRGNPIDIGALLGGLAEPRLNSRFTETAHLVRIDKTAGLWLGHVQMIVMLSY